MHISIMLVFGSFVRNSVVLAVYLLFSVACFFTVHEHSISDSLGILFCFIFSICDIMSVSEREQTKFVHRERRMAIMNEVHDIMSAREPEGACSLLANGELTA